MKKPTFTWTIAIAPSMITMIDAAEKRDRKPTNNPNPPKNSPAATR